MDGKLWTASSSKNVPSKGTKTSPASKYPRTPGELLYANMKVDRGKRREKGDLGSVCISQLVPEQPLSQHCSLDMTRPVSAVQPYPFVVFCDGHICAPTRTIDVQRVFPDHIVVGLTITVFKLVTRYPTCICRLTNGAKQGTAGSTHRTLLLPLVEFGVRLVRLPSYCRYRPLMTVHICEMSQLVMPSVLAGVILREAAMGHIPADTHTPEPSVSIVAFPNGKIESLITEIWI